LSIFVFFTIFKEILNKIIPNPHSKQDN
jgi:hypothetical protein